MLIPVQFCHLIDLIGIETVFFLSACDMTKYFAIFCLNVVIRRSFGNFDCNNMKCEFGLNRLNRIKLWNIKLIDLHWNQQSRSIKCFLKHHFVEKGISQLLSTNDLINYMNTRKTFNIAFESESTAVIVTAHYSLFTIHC